jgi:hypothetical protein
MLKEEDKELAYERICFALQASSQFDGIRHCRSLQSWSCSFSRKLCATLFEFRDLLPHCIQDSFGSPQPIL